MNTETIQLTRPPKSVRRAAWLPTPEQELLLRAALLHGEPGYSAWAEWKTKANFNNLDEGSYRLLPLVYHNLKEQKIGDDLTDKLKGIYRKTWYKNQLLFHHASEVLRLFNRAGIESVIFKGVPMALVYYHDIGLRPMSDVDVFIEEDRVQAAFETLKAAGWIEHPWVRSPRFEHVVESSHECLFHHPGSGSEIDIHWRLFLNSSREEFNKGLWTRRSNFDWGNVQTATLDPTDEFILACGHGANANPVHPIRWITDAHMISRLNGSHIDWVRVVQVAHEERMVIALRKMLKFLRANSIVSIPDDAIREIDRVPVKFIDVVEYWGRISQPSFFVNLLNRWFYYSRTNYSKPLIYRLATFPRHMQIRWGVEGWWQFLRTLFQKTRNRVWIIQQ